MQENASAADCQASRVPSSNRPTTNADAVIEVRGISKRFRDSSRPALDNVSFQVAGGAVYGLLGPNGAGKTTMLSILTGLMAPTAGQVFFTGDQLTGRGDEGIPILGVAPQDPAFYPLLTARENLEFFGRMFGLSGARLRKRIAWCLDIGELGSYADQRADTFSGGYKRRLNLAISLINEPSVLVLDEPTMAIDPHSRRFIQDRLRDLNRSGVTILLSTHYLEEAEQLCDAVAVLDQGRLVAQGSVEKLLAAYRPRELALELAITPEAGLLEQLRTLPEVTQLAARGCHVCMHVTDPATAAPIVLRVLEGAGVQHLGLSYGAARFESVFLRLTGGE